MSSAAKARRAAKKSAKANGTNTPPPAAVNGSVDDLTSSTSNLSLTGSDSPRPGTPKGDESEDKSVNRTASGVLTSHPDSRDIKIEQFSLSFYSQHLVVDSTIELNFGRRYGLIGDNGCGKSTFLECLAAKEVPIPEHIDIYLLKEEYKPTELTAVEAVIQEAEDEIKVGKFFFFFLLLVIETVFYPSWQDF